MVLSWYVRKSYSSSSLVSTETYLEFEVAVKSTVVVLGDNKDLTSLCCFCSSCDPSMNTETRLRFSPYVIRIEALHFFFFLFDILLILFLLYLLIFFRNYEETQRRVVYYKMYVDKPRMVFGDIVELDKVYT